MDDVLWGMARELLALSEEVWYDRLKRGHAIPVHSFASWFDDNGIDIYEQL